MMTHLAQQTCDGANAYAFGIVGQDEAVVRRNQPVRLERLDERPATSAAEVVLFALPIVTVFLYILGLAVSAVHVETPFLFL